jgi:hypothetical protein
MQSKFRNPERQKEGMNGQKKTEAGSFGESGS